MGFLGAFLFFGALSCIFVEDDPVGAKIRANRKADYGEFLGHLSVIVYVVVIGFLFGPLAVVLTPFMIAYAYYLWIFCKWLYVSIPKWHKKLGPTYKLVGSYFWDDDSF